MTNISNRYMLTSDWSGKRNKAPKEIQIPKEGLTTQSASNNTNSTSDKTLSSSEVINFIEMSCGNYKKVSSIFELKFVDKDGNVVVDSIDYSSLVENNNNSTIITGDKNAKQEKVRAMLEELKPQYKEVAKRALAPVLVDGTSRLSLLDIINFDDVYSKTVDKFLSELDENATTISRIVDDFSKALSKSISIASQGDVNGVYKPSEDSNVKGGGQTSSIFSLKFVDKKGLPVTGSIDYDSIIKNNNSQYISGKENIKSMLEELKPQYKEIAQNAIVSGIVREGVPRPTLLDKIDFDDVYSKTVDKFLSGLSDYGMPISRIVDDFSEQLSFAISLAAKGNVNGNFGNLGHYHK